MGEGKTAAEIYAALQMAYQWKKGNFILHLKELEQAGQFDMEKIRDYVA